MTPGRTALIAFLVIWIGCSLGGMVLSLKPGLPGVVGFLLGSIAAAIVYRLKGGQLIGPGSN